MFKKSALLLVLGFTLQACVNEPPKIQEHSGSVPAKNQSQDRPAPAGGIVESTTKDEGVQSAAAFAAKKLKGRLKAVTKASTQVVAGKNYHMTIELQKGQVYKVVVYRRFDGLYQLTSQEVVRCGVFTAYSPGLNMCVLKAPFSPDGKVKCTGKQGKYDSYWNGTACEVLEQKL